MLREVIRFSSLCPFGGVVCRSWLDVHLALHVCYADLACCADIGFMHGGGPGSYVRPVDLVPYDDCVWLS